ncbi:DUF3109 family protein [Flexithrix dorotheae]|uniref:DUF3109 family protein n=1 Tax=Flexithrix dorotheae TaxID=70993 RepID=UPI0004776369|nr:DUF3109 family protein [Flexithrix dorotheae]
MIVVGNTILSDDIMENFFVCDLKKCKGACCVEGDLGAPLEDEEKEMVKNIFEEVKPYLSKEGLAEIEKQGVYIKDEEGDYSTPTINNRECAYAIYDEKGILKCGIEQAYLDGKIEFRKPISCHLYPIRISNYDKYDALNYDQWDICSPACSNGKSLGVPVYKFLKEPLIRKYGKDWYEALELEIEERLRHNI